MNQEQLSARYTGVAITLHWLIALALGGMIALGKSMYADDGQPIEWMFQLHKSIGITILVLMISRIAWRFMNPPPPLPESMKPLEAKASHGVHIGLYAIVVLLPLSGWVMVSVSPFAFATVLYGTVGWPHLPVLPEMALETREMIYPAVKEIHEILSWALIALFALHFLGAIKHEIGDEEGVLKRIIPSLFGRTAPPRAPARGALVAFGSAALFFGIIAGGPVIAQAIRGYGPAAESGVASNWQVNHEVSKLGFSGTFNGDDFSGTFNTWTADIAWGNDTLSENTVAVAVQTGSATTGDAENDRTLQAPEWFNTSKFPTATVSIGNFRREGDQFIGDAVLTIKEQTVTVPFRFTIDYPDADTAIVNGTTVLDRADINLGQSSDAGGGWVSTEIDVEVALQASRL